jgi:tetratricopeptide (TPR) repeat protein
VATAFGFFTLMAVSGQTNSSSTKTNKSIKSEIETAGRLLKESPKDFTLYIRRGLLYWSNQEADRAAADFQKSISLNPYKPSKKPLSDLEKFQKLELARAYYNLGSIDCFKKQYEGAIPFFTKTIALEPNFPEAYKNRGLVYRQLGQKEAAVADLKKAEEVFSSPKLVRWPPANARGPVSRGPNGEIDEPVSGHLRQ